MILRSGVGTLIEVFVHFVLFAMLSGVCGLDADFCGCCEKNPKIWLIVRLSVHAWRTKVYTITGIGWIEKFISKRFAKPKCQFKTKGRRHPKKIQNQKGPIFYGVNTGENSCF